jgi:hypothetical protein
MDLTSPRILWRSVCGHQSPEKDNNKTPPQRARSFTEERHRGLPQQRFLIFGIYSQPLVLAILAASTRFAAPNLLIASER